MSDLMSLVGLKGLLGVIGLGIFLYCYRYSIAIFDWIEKQTLGTRTYIMEKMDLLMIQMDPDKLTIYLLALSFGLFTTTVVLFGLLFNWGVGIILGIVVGVLSFRLPRPVVDRMVDVRIKQYQGQMVDALQLLSNGIRAGLSVPQGIGMVVAEMPPPIQQEFNLILQQNRLGVPLEECFENLAKRIPLEDNDMFVSSMNILRETGGNLAEVFDTIVDVIRERVRLQQKIDTYTAQGMFQGYTIAAMPLAITGIYASSDPDSIIGMFKNPIGIILFIIAMLLDLAGLYVIMKIVKIKI